MFMSNASKTRILDHADPLSLVTGKEKALKDIENKSFRKPRRQNILNSGNYSLLEVENACSRNE